MWLCRVSGISDETDDLPTPHFVASLYAETSRLQVRIKRKLPATKIQNDVIPTNSLERDWNSTRRWTRHILRNPVFSGHNNRVSNCQCFCSVTAIRLVVL